MKVIFLEEEEDSFAKGYSLLLKRIIFFGDFNGFCFLCLFLIFSFFNDNKKKTIV